MIIMIIIRYCTKEDYFNFVRWILDNKYSSRLEEFHLFRRTIRFEKYSNSPFS